MHFSAYGIELVPIVIAIVGLCLQLGVPPKFGPLLSITIGVGLSLLFVLPPGSADWRQSVLTGMMLGLSSTGLHSGVKNIAESVSSQSTLTNGADGNKSDQNGPTPP